MTVKSQKEQIVEEKLIKLVNEMVARYSDRDELPRAIITYMLASDEIKSLQDYANIVSISRLGFNDHGPVHMKIVCRNALKMLRILHDAGIKTSIEQDSVGSFSDSMSAVIIAALLHDTGMTIARKSHELYSGIVSYSIINTVLQAVLPHDSDVMRRTVISSTAMECIIGHMGTYPIHSIEAGVILAADGCDMTKGRARISLDILTKCAEGDIHKYSAHAIEKVSILPGEESPLKIEVQMTSEVGLFQVEEVLIPKLQSSSIKPLIELYAGVDGEDVKRYL